MAGQRAWAPVGPPAATPPPRDCIGSSAVNPPQARGGNKTSGRHEGPIGRGRLYMIPRSNYPETLFLPLCLHSGALLPAGCRGASVALSPLRCPESSPAGIGCIGFPVVNLPGAAGWAQGLPGGAPKNPRPTHMINDIATNHLLNGPQGPFLTPRRSRKKGQEKSWGRDKKRSV